MPKKRLIFTLLYNDGDFMLSRNFRLQRAGNIQWLRSNYNFRKIAFTIDELIVLDVSREARNSERFCDHIKSIGQECFIPIAAGGGIMDAYHARAILNSGADKLVVNTALFVEPLFVKELVSLFGGQCIIASIDVKWQDGEPMVYINNGATKLDVTLFRYIEHVISLGVGEIYLNSMEKDGTGHGYMFELLSCLGDCIKVPIILAGGAGNWHHLWDGLRHDLVDAVATANLFNFIGQGFPNARNELFKCGLDLAKWEVKELIELRNVLSGRG